MELKNLKQLDWKSIKNNAQKRMYSLEISKADKEMIFNAVIEDLKPLIDFKKHFMLKRHWSLTNEAENLLGVMRAFIDNKIKNNDIYWWELDRKIINYYKDDIMKKFLSNKKYVFQHILDEMKIDGYSIPYSRSRTIERNHDAEIVDCAFSPYLQSGYCIVKTKRKYIGLIIIKIRGNCASICPIELQEAVNKIAILKTEKIKTYTNEKELERIKEILIEKQI